MTKAKILIVSNEAAAADKLHTRMQELGYEIAGIAASGDQAVRLAEETHPQWILMDAMLHQLSEGASQLQKDVSERLRDSEDKFRAIFESAADGMLIADDEGNVVMMNRQAEILTGYKRDELIGQSIDVLVPSAFRASHAPRRRAFGASTQSRMMGGLSNIRLCRKDGSELPVDISLATFETSRGRQVISIVRDVSERQRVDAELQRLNRTLTVLSECNQALIRAASEPELLTAICNRLVQEGGYRMAWIGFPQHDQHRMVNAVAHAGDSGGYLDQIKVSWQESEHGLGPTGIAIRERRTVAFSALRHDQRFEPWRQAALAQGFASSIALPLLDGDTVLGALSIYSGVENAFDHQEIRLLEELAADVSYGVVVLRREQQRLKVQAQLDYQADYDIVTGLANRRLLSALLDQVVALSQPTRRRLAVVIVDVGRFAAVNESLGHLAGDRLLAKVGKRIADCVGEGDTVARLDGDRFAVVAANLAHDDDADLVVRKVMSAFAAPFLLDDRPIGLTASAGVAVYPIGGDSAESLLKNAAAALNRAKVQGLNQFRFYTEDLNAGALARLELEAALRQAIDKQELLLHYQPKVDLKSGHVSGAEALLRWQRPQHGMVAPLEFIPLAEKTGLIGDIGNWVIDTACRQIREWMRQNFADIRVAVNVSAYQFREGNLKTIVTEALRRHGVPAQYLELELTESMLMDHPDEAAAQLRELKEIGIKLALDDFGTGYSSLSYLSRFPIDVLKIDRSFVTEMVSEPAAATIANSIIALAHRMRIKVVAEGVENEAQLGYLSQNRCDEIQGYYFSRPLAVEAFTAMLREGKSLPARVEPRDTVRTHTMLVVDNDPATLSGLRRLLQRDDCEVLAAGGMFEGFDLLAKHTVQLVLCSQTLAGASGTEFLRQVKELHPDTIRIVLADYSELEPIARAINDGTLHTFLAKPWDDDQLREQINEAFAYYDAVIWPRAMLD